MLVGLLLALFVLEEPWSWVVLGVAVAWEIAETTLLVLWSQRRQAHVGIEALVGRRAIVAADCMPDGQVRVAGELWGAHCEAGAGAGDEVVVLAAEGLTLLVEPV